MYLFLVLSERIGFSKTLNSYLKNFANNTALFLCRRVLQKNNFEKILYRFLQYVFTFSVQRVRLGGVVIQFHSIVVIAVGKVFQVLGHIERSPRFYCGRIRHEYHSFT